MRKKLHFTGLALFLYCNSVFAQLDQEFWFAAPDISRQHQQDDRPVRFRMSTLDEGATIQISMPANPGFTRRTVTIGPNETSTVTLSNPGQYENSSPNQVLNKGFLVTATAPISCSYAVGERWNVDIFALKGRNALGQDFIMPTQNFWNTASSYSDARSSLTLVATENRTVVTIIPSERVVGYAAGDTITLILDRGETYTNYLSTGSRGPSLNGSIIKSNKPIAVTASDDSMQSRVGGCRDLAGDQLVPIGVLGKEHIVAKGALREDEKLFITAVHDSTQIFINGNPQPLDTLHEGETYTYDVVGLTYLQSTEPVYVMHYTGIGCEIGGALIPSINCKGSSQVGFTRSSGEEFYLTVLVPRGGEQFFTVNGNGSALPSDSFVPVPGTNSEWMISSRSYSLSEMPVGRGYLLRNEEYSFQLGILDGGPGSGTRYGYFSNFASLFIGDDFTLCTGADREIFPKGEPGASYLWSDGSTASTLTVSEPGDYWVSMTNSSGCTLTDTLTVQVNPADFLRLDSLTGGCTGDLVTVDGGVQASYEWSNGTNSRFLQVQEPGIYSLEVIDANGCVDQDSVEVQFQERHQVNLGPNQTVCSGVDVEVNATTAGAETYRWQDGFEEAQREVLEPGLYWAEVTIGQCAVRDTFILENHPKPETPEILGTSVVCPGVQEVRYESSNKDYPQFIWDVDGGTYSSPEKSVVDVSWGAARNDALLQLIIVDSLGCLSDTSQLDVRINVNLQPPIPTGDTLVCSNANTHVLYDVAPTNGSTYRWILSAGENVGDPLIPQAAINWPGPGTYQLQVVEESVTTDTVCAGTSAPLEVVVFTDSARIDLRRVTTSPTDDSEIQVIWEINDPSRIDGDVRLSRSSENDGPLNLELDKTVSFFVDFDLPTSSQSYRYELQAINGCQEALVTATHESIVLTGEGEEATGQVTLEWNPYMGWSETPNYELWRLLDKEEDFKFFRNLNSESSQFMGVLATDGFDHQYRVKAVGRSPDEFSWSNIVELAFDHELQIPNVFTPNADGINDQFVIDNIQLYENNVFEVFDRQGNSVYRSSGYRNDWDGKDVPAGQYFYQLSIRNLDLAFNGVLTILR